MLRRRDAGKLAQEEALATDCDRWLASSVKTGLPTPYLAIDGSCGAKVWMWDGRIWN
ncbi:hypothetical protein B0G80_0006 [Paraburkholderia sp. BL6669N2]|nr:hypothetical protein B0G80_0006 [Paraburkholderia sp. BL6669N2]